MGWKLGYITSLDETRGAVGATMTASVGAKYDELTEVSVAKVSEYDGDWALSKGVGKFGSALDSGWCSKSKLVSGDRGAFSEGTGKSRLSPSVVPRRPLVFSGGKITSELESGEVCEEIIICSYVS